MQFNLFIMNDNLIIIIRIEFFYLQVYSPSKLRFNAYLFREDSQSTKHSQKPERIFDTEDSFSRKGLVE